MTKDSFLPTAEYFLRLVRYGIGMEKQEAAPPEKPECVLWEDIFRLSESHYLSAVTYCAIRELEHKPEKELLEKWEHAYGVCVHIDVQQAYAWEELKQAFSEKGLKLLPLKGLCIKELYPDPSLRLMSDLDILYEKSRFSEVREALLELGYSYRKETAGSNHQVFERAPDLHVEMHSALLPAVSPFAEYYSDAWSRATPTEEDAVYRFSREDEYVFLLIHAWKHFHGAGCGARTIADFSLFLGRYKDELNREYISGEIEKADALAQKNGQKKESLAGFEKFLFAKTEQWFYSESIGLDDSDERLLLSGVYGRRENVWRQECEGKGRFRYLLSRAFPPYRVMKASSPVLEKLPFLLPFFWLKRLFRALFFKRKEVNRELRFVNSVQKNKETNINNK